MGKRKLATTSDENTEETVAIKDNDAHDEVSGKKAKKDETSASSPPSKSVLTTIDLNMNKAKTNEVNNATNSPTIVPTQIINQSASDDDDEYDDDDDEDDEDDDGKKHEYVCRCGYDPRKINTADQESKYHKCATTVALLNHITFPSLQMLSVREKPSCLYYNLNKKNQAAAAAATAIMPSKHWALLVEIVTFESTKTTFSLKGKTLYDEEVNVEFDNKNTSPTTFSWSDMGKGKTLAILYAEKKDDEESSTASATSKTSPTVVVSNLDYCFVFKASLNVTLCEASQLLENADKRAAGSDQICFQCEMPISAEKTKLCLDWGRSDPQTCAKCKLLVFCSKECQGIYDKVPNSDHKSMCDQMQTLLNLTALPRHSFAGNRYFSFRKNEQPNYVLKESFIQVLTFPTPNNTTNNKCGLCNRDYRSCWIDKRSNLTKTECCDNWICDDEDACDLKTFSGEYRNQYLPSCIKSHTSYSICAYHFNEGHRSAKWQTCKDCKAEQGARAVNEDKKEWHTFKTTTAARTTGATGRIGGNQCAKRTK